MKMGDVPAVQHPNYVLDSTASQLAQHCWQAMLSRVALNLGSFKLYMLGMYRALSAAGPSADAAVAHPAVKLSEPCQGTHAHHACHACLLPLRQEAWHALGAWQYGTYEGSVKPSISW
jgi:hypothetical protein